jgi:aldehyde:ferredoxin oxidoreductase
VRCAGDVVCPEREVDPPCAGRLTSSALVSKMLAKPCSKGEHVFLHTGAVQSLRPPVVRTGCTQHYRSQCRPYQRFPKERQDDRWFTNRVAWVDLTSGNIEYKGIDETDARKYIGARGLGVKYVFDNGPDGRAAVARQHPVRDERPADRHRCQHERPPGCRDQVAADRHRGRRAHGRLDGSQAEVGRLRRPGLQGQGRQAGLCLCRRRSGDAARRLGRLGQGHPRDAAQILRERHGEGVRRHGDRAGRREPGALCLLGQHQRPRQRAQRHGRVGGSKHLKAIIVKGDKKNRPEPANKEADKEARKKALAAIMARRTSPPRARAA